jgi:hypothetical protein
MIKLDLGSIYPYSRIVSGAAGKDNHILAADRPLNGYFYFAVGKSGDFENIYPVEGLCKRNTLRIFNKLLYNTGGIAPHRLGSNNDKFMHIILR